MPDLKRFQSALRHPGRALGQIRDQLSPEARAVRGLRKDIREGGYANADALEALIMPVMEAKQNLRTAYAYHFISEAHFDQWCDDMQRMIRDLSTDSEYAKMVGQMVAPKPLDAERIVTWEISDGQAETEGVKTQVEDEPHHYLFANDGERLAAVRILYIAREELHKLTHAGTLDLLTRMPYADELRSFVLDCQKRCAVLEPAIPYLKTASGLSLEILCEAMQMAFAPRAQGESRAP